MSMLVVGRIIKYARHTYVKKTMFYFPSCRKKKEQVDIGNISHARSILSLSWSQLICTNCTGGSFTCALSPGIFLSLSEVCFLLSFPCFSFLFLLLLYLHSPFNCTIISSSIFIYFPGSRWSTRLAGSTLRYFLSFIVLPCLCSSFSSRTEHNH